MTISSETIPGFTVDEALAFASRHYGLDGTVSRLPSERDQNFLITDARARRFVLKIANSGDAPELLDFQNQALQHVESRVDGCQVQRVVRSLQGLDIAAVRDQTGRGYCMRLMTWIDGEVLANCSSTGPALFESLGAALSKVDAALCGFSHPAMNRVLQWDLRRAGMARENIHWLPKERRHRVEHLFVQWDGIDWSRLRHSVIHGDANDHNIIVREGRMVGLLDFGDMVRSATVCELAVTLAYVMFGRTDPLSAAAQVIGAYQRNYPLTRAEQEVLFPLILSRLCMTVCYAAHNRARNPDDAYQVVSEAAAWEVLDRLETYTADDALAMIQ
jgi:Ser/Thr protein kinase RdoA (MazF antagonist)